MLSRTQTRSAAACVRLDAAPHFSVLHRAIGAAGLSLPARGCVAAPKDAAFASLLTTLDVTEAQLFSERDALVDVLKTHIYPDCSPGALASLGGEVVDFDGKVFVSRGGTRAAVLETTRLCDADIQVYAIDAVLLPGMADDMPDMPDADGEAVEAIEAGGGQAATVTATGTVVAPDAATQPRVVRPAAAVAVEERVVRPGRAVVVVRRGVHHRFPYGIHHPWVRFWFGWRPRHYYGRRYWDW